MIAQKETAFYTSVRICQNIKPGPLTISVLCLLLISPGVVYFSPSGQAWTLTVYSLLGEV